MDKCRVESQAVRNTHMVEHILVLNRDVDSTWGKDGDMQSGDIVASGCLLDFSPEEWNSDVSSLGFMPAHKSTTATSRDRSGQPGRPGRQVLFI